MSIVIHRFTETPLSGKKFILSLKESATVEIWHPMLRRALTELLVTGESY